MVGRDDFSLSVTPTEYLFISQYIFAELSSMIDKKFWAAPERTHRVCSDSCGLWQVMKFTSRLPQWTRRHTKQELAFMMSVSLCSFGSF